MIYFVFFPRHFDANLSTITALIEDYTATGAEIPFGPGLLAAIQIFQGILLSPLLNLVPIFGEEFGWRGYLLPKLLPLGERKAYIISGLIWGVWHIPVILMGYNYGIDYPGAPWSGALLFIFISFVLGTFFGWASLRAGNIWPASLRSCRAQRHCLRQRAVRPGRLQPTGRAADGRRHRFSRFHLDHDLDLFARHPRTAA